MRTVPLAIAKAKLGRLVNDVISAGDAVTITRRGVPVAVPIGFDEFEGWQETLSIRGNPALGRALKNQTSAALRREIERRWKAYRRGGKTISLSELRRAQRAARD